MYSTEKVINKNQDYTLIYPHEEQNHGIVKLSLTFSNMIDDNHVRKFEEEFNNFYHRVNAIIDGIQAKQ